MTILGCGGRIPARGWWAVAALAVTGDVEQARMRMDWLCAGRPPLLSEQVDPVDGTSLGNVPLVWSHMELARALYLLDAARLRQRYGPVALAGWRIARYAKLRWQHTNIRSRHTTDCRYYGSVH